MRRLTSFGREISAPIHSMDAPSARQRDIAAAIPAHLVRYEEFANCGHGVVPDAPDDAMALLREFIAG